MLDAFVQSLALFRDKTPQCGTIDTYCGATYVNKSVVLDINGTANFLLIKKITALFNQKTNQANNKDVVSERIDSRVLQ